MPKNRQLLFIFADDNSHLQKTMPIAKYYGNLGFETHYSGPKLLIKYTLPNGFSLYPLVTKPLYLSQSKWFKTGVCLEVIEQQYDQRLHELSTMIEKIKPEIIFFDSFCFSDIVLVKALKSKARLVPFANQITDALQLVYSAFVFVKITQCRGIF